MPWPAHPGRTAVKYVSDTAARKDRYLKQPHIVRVTIRAVIVGDFPA